VGGLRGSEQYQSPHGNINAFKLVEIFGMDRLKRAYETPTYPACDPKQPRANLKNSEVVVIRR